MCLKFLPFGSTHDDPEVEVGMLILQSVDYLGFYFLFAHFSTSQLLEYGQV